MRPRPMWITPTVCKVGCSLSWERWTQTSTRPRRCKSSTHSSRLTKSSTCFSFPEAGTGREGLMAKDCSRTSSLITCSASSRRTGTRWKKKALKLTHTRRNVMKSWNKWLATSLPIIFCWGLTAYPQKQKKETEKVTSTKTAPATTAPRDYPVKPVPFTSVHFSDAFWAPRLEINRKVTIPFAFKKDEETKRIYNFERAAAALRGEKLADKTPPGYPFDDTDVYKVIEGAAYALNVRPDPEL